MRFWQVDHPGDRLAIAQDIPALALTYSELRDAVADTSGRLGHAGGKQLGFILCRNNVASVVCYLAALQKGDAVALLNADLESSLLQRLVAAYQPEWIAAPPATSAPEGYALQEASDQRLVFVRRNGGTAAIYPDTAVLLSTSGTTGSPKMVRLSYRNIESNAASIVEYLALTEVERPITTLPFSYSYGLSVINSHLHAGAALLVTECGVVSREFWDFFRERQATSIAGVPFIYQMLQRLDLGKMQLPSLRTLTQAGGRMEEGLVRRFHQVSVERGWKLYVMYGQTEAAPRISYVPPDRLADKIGSIGVAIPRGRLSIDPQSGELLYQGENVMLGYASCRADLANGDELGGRLRTGDLGRQDEDGFFYITGRLKRFVKLFGNRVNLDDVEERLESTTGHPVAVVGEDEAMRIFIVDADDTTRVRDTVGNLFGIHDSAYRICTIDAIPYTSSGKKDYSGLPAGRGTR